MKTICVCGADGRTGKEVVRELTSNGSYDVRACIFTETSLALQSEHVSVFKCDVTNSDEVKAALLDVDAVISVIGHTKRSDKMLQTEGIKNIIKHMKENGVRRVLSLTGSGVRITGDRPSLIDRILNILVLWIDPNRIKDGISHVEALRSSDLDWTILRVLKLSNNTLLDRDIHLTEHGPSELITSRAKVARIMLNQIESEEFIRKLPVSS